MLLLALAKTCYKTLSTVYQFFLVPIASRSRIPVPSYRLVDSRTTVPAACFYVGSLSGQQDMQSETAKPTAVSSK